MDIDAVDVIDTTAGRIVTVKLKDEGVTILKVMTGAEFAERITRRLNTRKA